MSKRKKIEFVDADINELHEQNPGLGEMLENLT